VVLETQGASWSQEAPDGHQGLTIRLEIGDGVGWLTLLGPGCGTRPPALQKALDHPSVKPVRYTRRGTGSSRSASIHSASCSFSRLTRSHVRRACVTSLPGE